MKWRRFRTWAKWACTGAAGFVLAVAVVSAMRGVYWGYVPKSDDVFVRAGVARGLVLWSKTRGAAPFLQPGKSTWWTSETRGWCWGLYDEMIFAGQGNDWHAGTMYRHDASGENLGVSIVYPFLLFSLPAALLWYLDRRKPGPHKCPRCGYDRRGLASQAAACPECGTVPTK
jgi:hypothetical protein